MSSDSWLLGSCWGTWKETQKGTIWGERHVGGICIRIPPSCMSAQGSRSLEFAVQIACADKICGEGRNCSLHEYSEQRHRIPFWCSLNVLTSPLLSCKLLSVRRIERPVKESRRAVRNCLWLQKGCPRLRIHRTVAGTAHQSFL